MRWSIITTHIRTPSCSYRTFVVMMVVLLVMMTVMNSLGSNHGFLTKQLQQYRYSVSFSTAFQVLLHRLRRWHMRRLDDCSARYAIRAAA
jgi:hypothetical protein